MIKNAEAHTNGAPAVPNRLAMNRLGTAKELGNAAAREEDRGAEWAGR